MKPYAAVVAAAVLAAGGNLYAQPYLGKNFKGSTLFSDSNFIPPDTDGAIGVDHYVELINGRYSVYRKSDNVRVQTNSLDGFWSNVGLGSVSGTFDPRIIYDHSSGRWFASAVDNGGNPNSFYIAVSQTSNPTGTWKGVRIDTDATNTHWADFDTLGVNADGVFLGGNLFVVSSGSTDIGFYTVPKADLLLSTPSLANQTHFEFAGGSSRGFTQQMVTSFEPSNGRGVMLAGFNSSNRSKTFINNQAGVATLSTTALISSVTANNAPLGTQPNGTSNLEVGDFRFGSSAFQVGSEIWAVQCIAIGGRAGLQWYVFDEGTSTIKRTGSISDANHDYCYPSISANANGDVVIGYSRMGIGEFISAYASVGTTSGGVTSFAAPTLLKAGVANYFQDFSTGRNRWGDYSATNRDPADPQIFWLNQEYVSAANTWSTNISELIVPLANEVRWKDATNGTFATATNWHSGTAPTATSHTIFSRDTDPASASGYTVTMPAAVTTNDRLSVRQGKLAMALNGGVYTLTNASASTPSVTVGEFGGTPTFTLTNGALNSVNTSLASGPLSAGSIVVSTGAAWTNSAGFFVAGSSTAAGGAGTVILDSGSSQLAIGGTLKVWGNGNVNYNGGSLSAGAIDLTGGKILLSLGANKVLRAGSISITGVGKIDLSDNDMIVDYTGVSPIGSIKTLIQQGYNAGAWSGNGVTSSRGATSPNVGEGGRTALGYGEASNLGIGSFDSIPVDGTTVVIKYTYAGDATLDGQVDISDLGRLATAWQTSSLWTGGDFDYSGFVDISDLGILATNWQLGVGSPLGPSFDEALVSVGLAGVSVPEPAMIGVLGLCLAGVFTRRARRKTAAAKW